MVRRAAGGEAAARAVAEARGEAAEPLEVGGLAVEDADVMERGVVPGVELARHRERALEGFEIRPLVAVVRAEAREVDVGEIDDAVGLDAKEAMAARVARRVDRL